MDVCSPPSRDFPKKKCLQHVDQPPSLCCVSNHVCPKAEEFARSSAHGACRATLRACSLRWAGSSTHHGMDFFFMNNRSSSLQRGSAGEETSVWHQGDGENEGAFKGGRRRKGRIFFGVGLWCFGKVQRPGPLDQ